MFIRMSFVLCCALVGVANRVHAAGPELVQATGNALDRPSLSVRSVFPSVMLGAARAGSRLVAVGERGLVVLSDDGGTQWRQATVPVSVTLTAVGFADATHGFAVGHGGTVLATTDGGQTWTLRLDGRRIAQIELETAKAGGDAKSVEDAQRMIADGPDKPLLDLLVRDPGHVLVVGAYGIALETEDGGATWSSWRAKLDNPRGLHLYALRRQGPRIVIAGEQGLLLQSLDGGRNFQRLAGPYRGSYFTAVLTADGGLIVAGLRGNVWRSSDGGANWTQVPMPLPVSITGSALRSDGLPILVNQAGMVFALHGEVAEQLKMAVLPPLNGVLPLDDGKLAVLSMRGVQQVLPPAASSTEHGL